MTAEELLLELRDIQAPAEPGWWLLAPGHLVLVILISALLAGIWMVYKKRKTNRLFIESDQELRRISTSYHQDKNANRLALGLSKWLKQVSLLAFPDKHLEGLTGRPWLDFLDQSAGNACFTRGTGEIFGGGVYREQLSLDTRQLLALCEQWLIAIKPHLLQQGRY